MLFQDRPSQQNRRPSTAIAVFAFPTRYDGKIAHNVSRNDVRRPISLESTLPIHIVVFQVSRQLFSSRTEERCENETEMTADRALVAFATEFTEPIKFDQWCGSKFAACLPELVCETRSVHNRDVLDFVPVSHEALKGKSDLG